MKTLFNKLSDRLDLSSRAKDSSYPALNNRVVCFTVRLLQSARYFPLLYIYILYVRVCVCVRVYINTAIYFLSEVTVVSVSICNLLGILKLRLSEKPARCQKSSNREALSNSHLAGLSQERSLP